LKNEPNGSWQHRKQPCARLKNKNKIDNLNVPTAEITSLDDVTSLKNVSRTLCRTVARLCLKNGHKRATSVDRGAFCKQNKKKTKKNCWHKKNEVSNDAQNRPPGWLPFRELQKMLLEAASCCL
jgi:hypothetical protein